MKYHFNCSSLLFFLCQVPDRPPQSIEADNFTSEATIPVAWTPVPDGHVNGLLIGYSIRYQRIWTAERSVFETEEETITVIESEMSVLLPVQTYSRYKIKVAAFTQAGMGPYTEYVYAGR